MTPDSTKFPGPIDVVYTWVDDQFPGYQAQLHKYATVERDTDPSRTRDNLETLRYSLRSLHAYAPWINRIFIVSCRPQIPHWLETTHPKITVIHHDQIMDEVHLPTFNSLSIITHLHNIPGLSENFIYFEDDMLLLNPITLEDFVAPDGKLWVFEERFMAPRKEDIADPAKEIGWNLALAESNRLLDEAYGAAPRRQVNHSPLLINKSRWQAVLERFPESLSRTRTSRFRAQGNLAPDFLYLQVALAEGQARIADIARKQATTGYVPLEDFWPLTAREFWKLNRRGPKWVTLNDNFGAHPSRISVALTRRQLQSWLPEASPYERL